MSSTYVIGKSAAACVDANGVLYYLLMEQSYESNVFPKTPSWSVKFFGRYEDCINRVIRCASSVEGGALRGEARTPTAYIKQWRDKLANPGRLDKSVLSVVFDGSFYGLPKEALKAVADLAVKHGQPGPVEHRLKVDMEHLGALAFLADLLSGSIKGLYPWRFFRHTEPRWQPEPGLGTPVPKATRAQLEGISVYRIEAKDGSNHDYYIANKDQLRTTGWHYSTIQSFICEEAIAAELLAPGAAEPMIQAFRKMVDDAPPMPANTRILITKPGSDDVNEKYHRERIEQFCSAMGLPSLPTVEVSFDDVLKANLAYELRYLVPDHVSFQLVATPGPSAPEQQSLLAA